MHGELLDLPWTKQSKWVRKGRKAESGWRSVRKVDVGDRGGSNRYIEMERNTILRLKEGDAAAVIKCLKIAIDQVVIL